MENQTKDKFIPKDGNDLGIGFFVQKNENSEKEGPYKGRSNEKLKFEDISYDDTIKKGEDYIAFSWIPYGEEITLPSGNKAICKVGMFD